jgi:hypothetical protein
VFKLFNWVLGIYYVVVGIIVVGIISVGGLFIAGMFGYGKDYTAVYC